jgi:adenylate cyclase
LKEFVPTQTYALPQNKVEILKSKRLEKLVRVLRNILREKPLIAEKMLVKTQQWSGQGTESREIRILKSLIKMYKSPDSHFLNYYGPPTTINTVPYYQILQTRKEPTPKAKTFDLKGKAVFVGLSERFQLEQKDGFYTVFSQSNGVDLSGVEIAATAFANLLEDRPLRRFPIHTEAVFILLCGLILGFLCRIFSPGISAACVIGLSITYLTTAHFQFKNSANWYPIVLPLFFQAPLAFFGSLLWRYSDTNKERKRIRNALGYYLPDKVADQLAKKIRDLTEENQLVHGVCLFTDAGRYTELSEAIAPDELSNFMRKYFEAIFKPVRDHGGIVIDIKGDSMLALWETTVDDFENKKRACLAALDISKAVERFNQSSGNRPLAIRIGVHSGRIMLGNVGALDHYEYRPTGDPVNTASRLEGLNKTLKTEILVSADVLDEVNGFLDRRLGNFLLSGKKNPTAVCELVCLLEAATEQQKSLCDIFSEGLSAYFERRWDEAVDCFQECLKIHGKDGPAEFYINRCEQYKKNPPGEKWDGLVCLDKK